MNVRFARIAPLSTVLLGLLGACGAEAPTEPVAEAYVLAEPVTPGHAEPGEALPFRLDADAVFAGQDFAPDFGPPRFGRSDFSGRCSAPADFVIRFSLQGRAAHLGEVAGGVEHCTHIDFATGATSVADGTMTLSTANGDELLATYVGQAGPAGLEEQVTFIGGTGRFTGATGHAVALPACDPSTGTCTWVMEGVLAYAAGDVAVR